MKRNVTSIILITIVSQIAYGHSWQWQQQAKILAPDGGPEDHFGYLVALSEHYGLISAHLSRADRDDSPRVGSVYVVRQDGGKWALYDRLFPPLGESGDHFGAAVAISGQYAIVGADRDRINGIESGSAYIFRQRDDSWILDAKLIPPDTLRHCDFGLSVSIDGQYAAVGAAKQGDPDPGSVYVFQRSPTAGWVPDDLGGVFPYGKIVPPDGQPADAFRMVSLNGDRLIVGAYGQDASGGASGAAYVFRRDPAIGWVADSVAGASVPGKILPYDNDAGDHFGKSVALSGDRAAVGAWLDDNECGHNAGSVYIFEWDGQSWIQQAKLLAADGAAEDHFGYYISLDGDQLGVSAHDKDGQTGAAYIFRYDGEQWVQDARLRGADTDSGDYFGAISISGGNALIGAFGQKDNGYKAGSAYMFAGRKKVFFVDDAAAGAEDGSSWKDAFVHLQDALAHAEAGDAIWVAQGTYRPDRNTLQPDGTGDQAATFELLEGVLLQGGYAGITGVDPNVRNPHLYPSILSGDLLANDSINTAVDELNLDPSRSDNSFCVMSANDLDNSITLDGFTVCGGHNTEGLGGAICSNNSNITITGCIFRNNVAFRGGALAIHTSNISLTNCVLLGNAATDNDSPGEAMGGAIWCDDSTTQIINCTFSHNLARHEGSVLAASSSDCSVVNSILWNNSFPSGASGPLYYDDDSTADITYSTIEGGWPGVGNIHSDPIFANGLGADAVAGTSDDNLRLLRGSACIDAGNNSALGSVIGTDLDGNARFTDDPYTSDTGIGSVPVVDMGAYEFPASQYTWLTYRGHRYAASLTIGTWEQVQAEAVAVGGDLVTINDDQENTWLAQQFGSSLPTHRSVWIGLSKDNAAWYWTNGEQPAYMNICDSCSRQPGVHMYLHTAGHPSAGSWNYDYLYDAQPTYYLPGIIEVPADSEWQTIQDEQHLTQVSGSRAQAQRYRIFVPLGQTYLNVRSYGGDGECDLAVWKHPEDIRISSHGHTDEEVQVYAPESGSWYIEVQTDTSYSNVTLMADFGRDLYLPLEVFADLRWADSRTNKARLERGPGVFFNTYSQKDRGYRLTLPGQSHIQAAFDLRTVPAELSLTVTHATGVNPAHDSDGYAPIDIVVNDQDRDVFNATQVLANDYDVAEHHEQSYEYRTDTFAIPASMLRDGVNTLTFALSESARTGYQLAGFRLHNGLTANLRFASDAYVVDESQEKATVRILRAGSSSGVISADYSTFGITAEIDADFAGSSGAILFADGQTSQVIDIPLINDDVLEGSETFSICLGQGSDSGNKGFDVQTIVTIRDNESAPTVLHVCSSAPPQGDGLSWDTAFNDLQDALSYARYVAENGLVDVWVCSGTYKPDSASGSRFQSFHLANRVAIYGGFAGWEQERSQRNWLQNPTILSGDLSDDDLFNHREENSVHVVVGRDINATSILDGFVVTSGSTPWGFFDINHVGGGLLLEGGSPIIRNCVFSENEATEGGGVFCGFDSNPEIRNCHFVLNSAELRHHSLGGGGLAMWLSNPYVVNCIFRGNASVWGGAILAWDSNPVLHHTTIIGNRAYIPRDVWDADVPMGGGLSALGSMWDSTVELHNCNFSDNIAPQGTEIVLGRNITLLASSNNVGGGEQSILCEGCADGIRRQQSIDKRPIRMTPDGHLTADSPLIDAATTNVGVFDDVDAEARPDGHTSDIGADEFIDSDGDRLPDWWERQYFGELDAGAPDADVDNDGLPNQQEYEVFSSNPTAKPYFVDAALGSDHYDGHSSTPSGGTKGPKKTIAAAIRAATHGDTIVVMPGTYKGQGNRRLSFNGKAIVLHAVGGPDSTILDVEGEGPAFLFDEAEPPAMTAVVGLTITNGGAALGSAILVKGTHPQIRNCIVTHNDGTAVYCWGGAIELANCTFRSNPGIGLAVTHGSVKLIEDIYFRNDDMDCNDALVTGSATIDIDSTSSLAFRDSRIRCEIFGPGSISVPAGSELIVEAHGAVDLGGSEGKGTIVCNGLLRVRDSAGISNGQMYVSQASFENHAIIENSIIKPQSNISFGQFFIEDTVCITNNDIHAQGDRYLDLEPETFQGVVQNNRIYLTIKEGRNNSRGGLLELRGKDGLASSSCDNSSFACQAEQVPPFSTDSWTIERLELLDDAKLNLTNRFDFGNGGLSEVLYVKELVLGSDSVLNTAYNRLYYEQLTGDASSIITVPLLGFSLNNIAFDNAIEYKTRVIHNNSPIRTHVERIEGLEPDRNGMMRMRNLKQQNPTEPHYLDTIHARAKGLFAKASEDEVLVQLHYLFETSNPNTRLLVYLSETADLSGMDAPQNGDRLVASIAVPPDGRPGSPGSGRFALYQQVVSAGDLDFTRGLRIQLELVGPPGTSVLINNWDPGIQCSSRCGDVAGSIPQQINAIDFLAVITECGRRIEDVIPANGSFAGCIESAFHSMDGYVTIEDAMAINCVSKGVCQCGAGALPLSLKPLLLPTPANPMSDGSAGEFPAPLLIMGKAYDPATQDFLKDRIYGLGRDLSAVGRSYTLAGSHLSGRLIRDSAGTIYNLNIGTGLVRLEDGRCVVPQSELESITEPRYGQLASVCVGYSHDKTDRLQHPIMDAAFSGHNTVYITPVVVRPYGNASPAYFASAKLKLVHDAIPAYELVQLYDAVDPTDNILCNGLREIEIDTAGNLYVANVSSINEGDVLWVFDAQTGDVKATHHLTDEGSDLQIPAPRAMHVSDQAQMLFLASALTEPDATKTTLYGISIEELLKPTDTKPKPQPIPIDGMGHITAITEDLLDRALWVTGFTMRALPDDSVISDGTILTQRPFYEPYISRVPVDEKGTSSTVALVDLGYDIALPLSVLCNEDAGQGFSPADFDSSGRVDFRDLAALAQYWNPGQFGKTSVDTRFDLYPPSQPDGHLNLRDLAAFADCWLE